jgi:hypothetical protein
MQLKANVNTQEVTEKRGNKNGKEWCIREQPVLVTLPNGEVRRLALSLEPNDAPLALGEYVPKDSAIYAARFGLEVSMRARHWQRVEAAKLAKVS